MRTRHRIDSGKASARHSRRRLVRSLLESLEARQLLASPTLDSTFGAGGRVTDRAARPDDVAVQSDGKLLVATDGSILRYNADGKLDTSFGGGDGRADLPTGFDANAIEVSGTKILFAGADLAGEGVVGRLNADGSADTSFGPDGAAGGGLAAVPGLTGPVTDLTLQNGKILAAGTVTVIDENNPEGGFTRNDLGVARLSADGTVDESFGGGDGFATAIAGGADSNNISIGIQPTTGDIFLAGTDFFNGGTGIHLARFSDTGAFEAGPTFDLGAFPPLQVTDLDFQTDGSVIVASSFAGSSAEPTEHVFSKLTRFTPAGTADPTFTSNGATYLDRDFQDIDVAADNSILVAGSASAGVSPYTLRAMLMRFNPNGSVDTSFSNGYLNTVRTGWDTNSRGTALAVQNDGKVVLAGYGNATPYGNPTNLGLARFTATSTQPPPNLENGLTGTYYDNENFTNPKFNRVDRSINFDFGAGSPAPSIGPDTLSIRWTGKIQNPQNGTYTFYVTADNRAELFIDGRRVVNTAVSPSGTIDLTPGMHDIRLDYIEGTGNAKVKLEWSGPGIGARQLVNTGNLFTDSTGVGDNTAPTAPPNFRVTGKTATSITVAWDASTDNVGVTEYRTFLNGTEVGFLGSSARGFTFNNLQPDTQYTLGVLARDARNNRSPQSTLTVRTNASGGATQTPFKGTPFAVNDTIQAEDFDNGGEGVAYHDVDAVNTGGKYRTNTGVDIESTGDTGGGLNVGYARPGEWLEYTINVAAPGNYDLQTRLAAVQTGKLHFEVDGQTKATLDVTPTVGFQAYKTVTSSLGNLTAGNHVLRLAFDSTNGTRGVANVNWLKLVPASSGTDDTQPPSAVPNFEDFSQDFPGVSTYRATWTAASDNVGVAGYRLTYTRKDDDNGTITTSQQTENLGPGARSWSINVPSSSFLDNFQIAALDAAGNVGPFVTPASSPQVQLPHGLKGTYFDNDNFTNPKLTRTDAMVNFDWAAGSPDASIGPDTFSARWSGYLITPHSSAQYTFSVPADDRAKLLIDDQVIIDYIPGQTSNTGTFDTLGGRHKITLEYREFTGNARVSLRWNGEGGGQQPIPSIRLEAE